MHVFRRLMDHWNVIFPVAMEKISEIVKSNWTYFQHFRNEEAMMTAVYKLVVEQKQFIDGKWISMKM